MKNCSAIRSGLFALVTLCVLAAGVLGSPAGGHSGTGTGIAAGTTTQSRAFKDLLLPEKGDVNLTKAIIDSTLSVLGVFAFTIAFIAIPVLALLYTGGSLSSIRTLRSVKSETEGKGRNSEAHIRLARGILDQDRCIERLVCEVSRGARNSRADKWADMIFNNVPSEGKFMRRVSDAYRARQLSCSEYSCEPVGFVVRLFIYATDWNTVLKG